MNTIFSHLFYLRKSKTKTDSGIIYFRITVNGKRAVTTTGREVPVSLWNPASGKATGNSAQAKAVNRFLSKVENDIYNAHQRLVDKGDFFSSKDIIDIYLGKDKKKEDEEKILLEIFQEHNDRVNRLVGKDFAKGTAERYRTAKKHVEEYIKKEYKTSDIPVMDVNHKFITGFEYYLKTERNCAHNSAIKYITNFKKIIRIAFTNEWISRDPFQNWKAKLKVVDREFLTEGELQVLISKEIKNERLSLVKDIFTFNCFTGLCYADVKKLSEKDVVVGFDGKRWIKTNRTKTKSSIPILHTAEAILEKYSAHPEVSEKHLIPILSNQKMNAYIKEIADICGINKNLTFHLARHTFATTVTLSNGVPIESVSKMLGHKNLQTTQHYAKILDRKISDDMAILRERLVAKNF
ncbi:recombinase [Salegentibacter salinarum]|uniref:Recombinase n=1 Tax=Salegentibacter salinarum TaxID=447422 RepID=A0A2N0U1G0_9FLAO|nr:site-specific integrase [Salegentibacter salinarum]PKD20831.1 recombinase [Salegentibacter salinarum]SKB78295.1 Site-specific recombinase XerD [Salegentibacter salinarum]